jgi:hypothetical protein
VAEHPPKAGPAQGVPHAEGQVTRAWPIRVLIFGVPGSRPRKESFQGGTEPVTAGPMRSILGVHNKKTKR